MNDARRLLRGMGSALLVAGALALLAGFGLMMAQAVRGIDAYAESIQREATREAMSRPVDASNRGRSRSSALLSLCFSAGIAAGVIGLGLRMIPRREEESPDLGELIARERAAMTDAAAQRNKASSSTSGEPPADRAG